MDAKEAFEMGMAAGFEDLEKKAILAVIIPGYVGFQRGKRGDSMEGSVGYGALTSGALNALVGTALGGPALGAASGILGAGVGAGFGAMGHKMGEPAEYYRGAPRRRSTKKASKRR